MSMQTEQAGGGRHLGKYLSPLSVWALSFGCAVGWGAFVMPGTTFLPAAGPLGTAIGIGVGAVIMLIIGMNYHFLMNKYPDAGGTLTYATRAFGYDHGFLSAWFLILVYVAIIWANATALALIARRLLGGAFQFGFHYVILGYDVYFGEALLSIALIVLTGGLCMRSKRGAVRMQTILAVLLLGGILVTAFVVFRRFGGSATYLQPAFSPDAGRRCARSSISSPSRPGRSWALSPCPTPRRASSSLSGAPSGSWRRRCCLQAMPRGPHTSGTLASSAVL